MNNDGAPTHETTPNSKDGDQEMLETSELRHRATPANKDQESSETETISIEREFDQKHVPSWRDQLTVRAFVVSFILSILFSIIVMKLNLTTGVIPSLNVSAGLLGFFFIRTWTAVIERTGLLNRPFTRQENTVIQTCVVAAYDIAFSGGFGSYLLGMSDIIAAQGTQDNAIILGDGLYNFLKVFSRILPALISTLQDQSQTLPIQDKNSNSTTIISFDDQKREKYFMKDQIRRSIALAGYLTMAVLSIITLPHIFPPLKWYYILIIYITAPILAFCNAYGAGLTDWNLASTYGKLFIFIIGAWAGASHGGVLAGLASCGVMMSIVSTSSDLMQDFRTGYMTLSSPKSMFISQVIGTGMGCVIAPCVFWLFFKAFKDVGVSGSQYPAPYAMIYRNVAVLGVL